MASNQSIIDELVVKLTLDAKEYKKTDKQVDQLVDATEKKQVIADTKRKKRETEQIKRNKEMLTGVKALAIEFRAFALVVGAVFGVGGAALGTVGALAGFETNLRRSAVSTGLSNRELQAWGSTARRLGADAQAGAAAIADLAREQKLLHLTGNSPTLAAFSRLGVNAGVNTPIVDILAQAQQRYRQAPAAQQTQIESTLAASGVSPDLIVAIKSEKDVREEFSRSYAESAQENRKAMDAVTDALESLKNSSLNVANSFAAVLQPYIETLASFASSGAQQLAAFTDDVIAAGGGVDGLVSVIRDRSPEMGELLDNLSSAFETLEEAVDLSAYGLKLIGEGFRSLFAWLDNKLSFLLSGGGAAHPLYDAARTVGEAVKWAWKESLNNVRAEGPLHLSRATQGAQLTGRETVPRSTSSTGRPGAKPTLEELRNFYVAHGVPLNEAIGLAANAMGESGLDPAAVNKQSGAAGLFQWLSKDRVAAVQAYLGRSITQASWQDQALAVLAVPSERARLNKAVMGASSAADYTAAISDRFEAHGNLASRRDRLGWAAQLNGQPGASTTGIGQQINIQSMTVQANTPTELVGGITRQSNTQNYNSAVR